jgi:hypothetical protein
VDTIAEAADDPALVRDGAIATADPDAFVVAS